MTKQFLCLAGFLALPFLTFAQVNPVQLGRASNAFSAIRNNQNQVVAHSASQTVAFIHRQDVTIWGGGSAESGKLRVDMSTDGGTTFSNDQGPLNQVYLQTSRYPQIVIHGDDSNPFANEKVWAAPTYGGSTWSGIANGVSDSPSSSTENYSFQGVGTYLPGGLCQGLPGEYWMADRDYNGLALEDTVRVLKGTYNSNTADVDWDVHKEIELPTSLSYDGFSRVLDPNMAFSPDGQTGWVAMLGDLVGGSDSTYNPILIKSTDAGATWENPIEVDLRTATFTSGGTLAEELQELWIDANLNPASTGRPTCSFEFDIVVDATGAPHLFTIVGSAATTISPVQAYSYNSGLAKLAVDITTVDGGQTWSLHKVSPVYTFRGQFGTPDNDDGSLMSMDNYPQVSRSSDGSHIFYSWVDSDTAEFTGAQLGVGFGEVDNLAPNLRIAGKRISDGYVSCPKWITQGDLIWDGKALWPTMAPEVLVDYSGAEALYKLPIVATEMITNVQSEPCLFWYFGNDATITESDFWGEAEWVNTDDCFSNPTVSVSNNEGQEELALYPVPASDAVQLKGLNSTTQYTLELVNQLGQIVWTESVHDQNQGRVDVAKFQNGYYNLRVISDTGMQIKRLVISK